MAHEIKYSKHLPHSEGPQTRLALQIMNQVTTRCETNFRVVVAFGTKKRSAT